MTVKAETSKKIGLVAAISMLIGSTIGIGIFFKNDNVFSANNANSIGILIAWIISGLISISTAFCFAEVGSSKQSHSGLGGWFEVIIGKRSGTFIKIIQPLFYFGILSFSISIFCGEAIFNIFNASSKVNFGIIMFVGLAIFILFIIFNSISIVVSSKFQVVVSGMKFIPLLMIILAGIIYGSMHPEFSLFSNIGHESKPLSFTGIIISIPSILFAFDSFIGVGNLSVEMKNPRKNVPLSIILGMVIVTIFYLLVTIGQIMVSQGNAYNVFELIFQNNDSARNAFHIIISVFIFISIIGVINAFSLVLIKSCQSQYEEQVFIFERQLEFITSKIKTNRINNKEGVVISLFYIISLFVALVIPSSIVNTDAFIDGVSNFPCIIFFSLYATIILGTLINRKTKKVETIKIKFFIPMSIISIVGCYFVTGFQLFYTFFAQTIIEPESTLSWGLFSTNGFMTTSWMGTIFMFLYLICMVIFYVISIIVIKKRETKIINEPELKLDTKVTDEPTVVYKNDLFKRKEGSYD